MEERGTSTIDEDRETLRVFVSDYRPTNPRTPPEYKSKAAFFLICFGLLFADLFFGQGQGWSILCLFLLFPVAIFFFPLLAFSGRWEALAWILPLSCAAMIFALWVWTYTRSFWLTWFSVTTFFTSPYALGVLYFLPIEDGLFPEIVDKYSIGIPTAKMAVFLLCFTLILAIAKFLAARIAGYRGHGVFKAFFFCFLVGELLFVSCFGVFVFLGSRKIYPDTSLQMFLVCMLGLAGFVATVADHLLLRRMAGQQGNNFLAAAGGHLIFMILLMAFQQISRI